jgi:hypothetical protein
MSGSRLGWVSRAGAEAGGHKRKFRSILSSRLSSGHSGEIKRSNQCLLTAGYFDVVEDVKMKEYRVPARHRVDGP